MGKIIFLFPKIKIVNTSLEDLELTEKFLTNKEVNEFGYNPEILRKAYELAEQNYKFV